MNEKPYYKSYKSFESVQDYIFKMYAEHTLEPGDCIFETEIAKQLNLSRTPVRDALGRLVANGFLEQQRGRRGYFLPHLTVNDMEDAYCARECMEVKIGYLAAQKANNYDIQKLQTINEFELSFSGENSNTQNRLEYMKANDSFHRCILQIADNRYIKRAYEPIYWRTQLYVYYLGPFSEEEKKIVEEESYYGSTPKEHARIIESIKNRDSDTAAKRCREHIHFAIKRSDNLIDKFKQLGGVRQEYVHTYQKCRHLCP